MHPWSPCPFSQAFFFFMILKFLKSIGQIFCRTSLSLDSPAISHDQAGVMGFRKDYNRDTVPFSLHQAEQGCLASTWLVTGDVKWPLIRPFNSLPCVIFFDLYSLLVAFYCCGSWKAYLFPCSGICVSWFSYSSAKFFFSMILQLLVFTCYLLLKKNLITQVHWPTDIITYCHPCFNLRIVVTESKRIPNVVEEFSD